MQGPGRIGLELFASAAGIERLSGFSIPARKRGTCLTTGLEGIALLGFTTWVIIQYLQLSRVQATRQYQQLSWQENPVGLPTLDENRSALVLHEIIFRKCATPSTLLQQHANFAAATRLPPVYVPL